MPSDEINQIEYRLGGSPPASGIIVSTVYFSYVTTDGGETYTIDRVYREEP